MGKVIDCLNNVADAIQIFCFRLFSGSRSPSQALCYMQPSLWTHSFSSVACCWLWFRCVLSKSEYEVKPSINYQFVFYRRTKGNLNIPMMYLHRYLRLTPVVALAILVYMTLLPFMGDGPLFNSIKFDDYNHCKKTWFWTLLFLQNYATPDLVSSSYVNFSLTNCWPNPHLQCINHSWYLGVDMQLYILSPIFLISLYKWGKKAAAGIFVFMLMLSACLFSTMMIKKYPIHME